MTLSSRPSVKLEMLLKLLAPFGLFCFFARDFISGATPLNLDSFANYALTKFYIDNLLQGVFPLWNPFVDIGQPFVSLVVLGLQNPLVLAVAVLVKAGLNFYHAYVGYLLLNLFLAGWGFFQLARKLLRHELLAVFCYTAFLFSSVGLNVFNQANLLLILVPVPWLFYFLLEFFEGFERRHFCGLALSAMLIPMSYLPFHALVLLGAFGLCCLLVVPGALLPAAKGLGVFLRKNVLLSVLAVTGLLTVSMPALTYRTFGDTEHFVSPYRRCIDKPREECPGILSDQRLGMTYDDVSSFGTIAERVGFRSLFSHLDKISYGIDGVWYLPAYLYLILLLAVPTRCAKLSLFLMALGAMVLTVALGQATVFDRFLYAAIPLFQHFRNKFFFIAYLAPILILLAASQLKAIFLDGDRPSPLLNSRAGFWLLSALHGLALGWLLRQSAVLATTLLTVILSWIVLMFVARRDILVLRPVLKGLLIVILLLEPAQVWGHYVHNARPFACPVASSSTRPVFSFQRHFAEAAEECLTRRYLYHYRDHQGTLTMRDVTWFSGLPLWMNRNLFYLMVRMPNEWLMRYLQFKLIAYDRVAEFGRSEDSIMQVMEAIHHLDDVAYVPKADARLAGFLGAAAAPEQNPPFAASGESALMKVLYFDVNTLRVQTNFPVDKFLVYVDSFHSGWKAFVNGVPAPLYRAQLTFKGVAVPAGKQTLEFRFAPPAGAWPFVAGTLFILIFGLFSLWEAGAFKNSQAGGIKQQDRTP